MIFSEEVFLILNIFDCYIEKYFIDILVICSKTTEIRTNNKKFKKSCSFSLTKKFDRL